MTSPPPKTSNPTNLPLGVNDAINYVNLVKNTYQEEPETYNRFLRAMGDFKNTRCVASLLALTVANPGDATL